MKLRTFQGNQTIRLTSLPTESIMLHKNNSNHLWKKGRCDFNGTEYKSINHQVFSVHPSKLSTSNMVTDLRDVYLYSILVLRVEDSSCSYSVYIEWCRSWDCWLTIFLLKFLWIFTTILWLLWVILPLLISWCFLAFVHRICFEL